MGQNGVHPRSYPHFFAGLSTDCGQTCVYILWILWISRNPWDKWDATLLMDGMSPIGTLFIHRVRGLTVERHLPTEFMMC